MKKEIRNLIIIYLIFTLIKIILSYFIKAPTAFSDEYVYAKQAWSIFHEHNLRIHNLVVPTAPPLYPFIISIAYIFKDMEIIYFIFKIINILIINTIIFPIYFLAREFLDEKKSLIAVLLVSVSAPIFTTSNYIMNENLFYPLFTLSIFVLYKAFTKKKTSLFILSGLLIGLTFLSKILAIALIPVAFLTYLRFIKSKEIRFKQIILHYLTIIITIIPWFMRNLLVFGNTKEGIYGLYQKVPLKISKILTQNFITFTNWFLLYIDYIILAVGIFLMLFITLKIKEKNYKILFYLIGITTLGILFLGGVFSGSYSGDNLKDAILYESPFWFFISRSMGRYIETTIPLVILLGFIGLINNTQKISKTKKIIIGLFLFIGLQLNIAQLIPPNNKSLAIFGTIKYSLNYFLLGIQNLEKSFFWPIFIILGLLIFTIYFLVLKIKNKKVIITLLFFWLITNSIISYGINIHTSNNWLKTDQFIFGKEINELNLEGNIYFDEKNCIKQIFKENPEGICEKSKTATLIGFWINNQIEIKQVEEIKDDYLISKEKYNFEIIKRYKDLNLYKIPSNEK